MTKIRVGILRGGPSSEHEVSLHTGATVLDHIDTNTYKPVDIQINTEGIWKIDDKEVALQDVFYHVDIVFNALHETYGEDGQVQRLLEQFGIPHTGSGASASALAMHKGFAKEQFKIHNIRTPAYSVLDLHSDDLAYAFLEAFHTVAPPYVLKPMSSGSSLGVELAHTFEEALHKATRARESYDTLLIESHIPGREVTCGVVEGLRGEEHYALPPVEICTSEGKAFFDYDAKYGGKTHKICPAQLSSKITTKIQNLAKDVHRALGLRQYSRTDFILTQKDIYVLEVNTLPGLTTESSLPCSLNAVGISLTEFISHLLKKAV